MRSLAAPIAALSLALGGPAGATIVSTKIGSVSTSAIATSIAIPISVTTTIGQKIIAIAYVQAATLSGVAAADNASTPNCAGAYHIDTAANGTSGMFILASCDSPTVQMTSAGNCGGGASACTITISWSTTTTRGGAVAFENTNLGAYDTLGSNVSISATGGTPFTGGPTSPALTTGDELVVAAIGINTPSATSDDMSLYSAGFTFIGSARPSATSAGGIWVALQELTSGAAQLNATSVNTRTLFGRAWTYKSAGSASSAICSLSLLGVGKC